MFFVSNASLNLSTSSRSVDMFGCGVVGQLGEVVSLLLTPL